MRAWSLAPLLLTPGCAALPTPASPSDESGAADPAYVRVVQRVSQMVYDARLRDRVTSRGLALVDVTWEDTGRALGSSLGPNISDFTLQVRHRAVPDAIGDAPGETPE